jgi:hypothetical protein
MNAPKHLLRWQVRMGRAVSHAGFRARAAILAVIGAGILVPAASAQTPFDMEMDTGGAAFSMGVTMPDPQAVAETMLQCGEASSKCMDAVWDAAMPVAEPSPSPPAPSAPAQPEPSPSPPAPPSPPQPEPPPDSTQPKDDSQASPDNSAGPPTRTAQEQAPTPEGVSPASEPEPAELGASPPLVQKRANAAPDVAPLRGLDALGLPAATPSLPPTLQPGLDWSPLMLSMLLAAGSLALLLFLLVAAPQHGLARVSYQLAERRFDLSLIAAVMLIGVAVGYFVATWVG